MSLGLAQNQHQHQQTAEPGGDAAEVDDLIEDQQLPAQAVEHGAVADRGQGCQQQRAKAQARPVARMPGRPQQRQQQGVEQQMPAPDLAEKGLVEYQLQRRCIHLQQR